MNLVHASLIDFLIFRTSKYGSKKSFIFDINLVIWQDICCDDKKQVSSQANQIEFPKCKCHINSSDATTISYLSWIYLILAPPN